MAQDEYVPVITYPHNELLDRLVVHLEFDGDMKDSSGRMRHVAAANGSTAASAGVAVSATRVKHGPGSAYFAGGTWAAWLVLTESSSPGGSVSIAQPLGAAGQTRATFAAWLYLNQTAAGGASNQTLVEQGGGGSGGSNSLHWMYVATDGRLAYRALGGAAGVDSAAALPTQQWVHVAIVRDDTDGSASRGLGLFIDGVLNATASLPSSAALAAAAAAAQPAASAAARWVLGRRASTAAVGAEHVLLGPAYLDDVRLYATALTASAVAALAGDHPAFVFADGIPQGGTAGAAGTATVAIEGRWSTWLDVGADDGLAQPSITVDLGSEAQVRTLDVAHLTGETLAATPAKADSSLECCARCRAEVACSFYTFVKNATALPVGSALAASTCYLYQGTVDVSNATQAMEIPAPCCDSGFALQSPPALNGGVVSSPSSFQVSSSSDGVTFAALTELNVSTSSPARGTQIASLAFAATARYLRVDIFNTGRVTAVGRVRLSTVGRQWRFRVTGPGQKAWTLQTMAMYSARGCQRGTEVTPQRQSASSNAASSGNVIDAFSQTSWIPSQNVAGEWIGVEMLSSSDPIKSIRLLSASTTDAPVSLTLETCVNGSTWVQAMAVHGLTSTVGEPGRCFQVIDPLRNGRFLLKHSNAGAVSTTPLSPAAWGGSRHPLVTAAAAYRGLALGTQWTLQVWLQFPLEASPGRRRALVSGYRQTPVGVSEAGTHIGASCQSSAADSSSAAFDAAVPLADLAAGWHHLTVVGSDGTQVFYVDGSRAGATTTQCTRDLLCIGNDCERGSPWGGAIAELLLFDQAALHADIITGGSASLFYTVLELVPLPLSVTVTHRQVETRQLVAYYTFDERAGTTAFDSSNNLNDATTSSRALWSKAYDAGYSGSSVLFDSDTTPVGSLPASPADAASPFMCANQCCGDKLELGSFFEANVTGAVRFIRTNGIPSHTYSVFSPDASPNPNDICEQRVRVEVPAVPRKGSEFKVSELGPVGIATSGAFIYNHLSSPTGATAVASEGASCYELIDGQAGTMAHHYAFNQTAYDAGNCDLDRANGMTLPGEGYVYVASENYPFIMPGYYGTTFASPTFDSSVPSACVAQTVSLPATTLERAARDVTFSMWVRGKADSAAAAAAAAAAATSQLRTGSRAAVAQGTLFHAVADPGNVTAYHARIPVSGAVVWAGDGWNLSWTPPSTQQVLSERWRHWAFVASGRRATATIFVDGEKVAQSPLTLSQPTSGDGSRTVSCLLLGAQCYGADDTFDGLIDELRIFNWALPPVEVAQVAELAVEDSRGMLRASPSSFSLPLSQWWSTSATGVTEMVWHQHLTVGAEMGGLASNYDGDDEAAATEVLTYAGVAGITTHQWACVDSCRNLKRDLVPGATYRLDVDAKASGFQILNLVPFLGSRQLIPASLSLSDFAESHLQIESAEPRYAVDVAASFATSSAAQYLISQYGAGHTLLVNRSGAFEDITAESGVGEAAFVTAGAAGSVGAASFNATAPSGVTVTGLYSDADNSSSSSSSSSIGIDVGSSWTLDTWVKLPHRTNADAVSNYKVTVNEQRGLLYGSSLNVRLLVRVWGAAGGSCTEQAGGGYADANGNACFGASGPAGGGGYSEGFLSVSPGESLRIVAGSTDRGAGHGAGTRSLEIPFGWANNSNFSDSTGPIELHRATADVFGGLAEAETTAAASDGFTIDAWIYSSNNTHYSTNCTFISNQTSYDHFPTPYGVTRCAYESEVCVCDGTIYMGRRYEAATFKFAISLSDYNEGTCQDAGGGDATPTQTAQVVAVVAVNTIRYVCDPLAASFKLATSAVNAGAAACITDFQGGNAGDAQHTVWSSIITENLIVASNSFSAGDRIVLHQQSGGVKLSVSGSDAVARTEYWVCSSALTSSQFRIASSEANANSGTCLTVGGLAQSDGSEPSPYTVWAPGIPQMVYMCSPTLTTFKVADTVANGKAGSCLTLAGGHATDAQHTVWSANLHITADVITAANTLSAGDAVVMTGTSSTVALSVNGSQAGVGDAYYVCSTNLTSSQFRLASSKEDAVNGTCLPVTGLTEADGSALVTQTRWAPPLITSVYACNTTGSEFQIAESAEHAANVSCLTLAGGANADAQQTTWVYNKSVPLHEAACGVGTNETDPAPGFDKQCYCNAYNGSAATSNSSYSVPGSNSYSSANHEMHYRGAFAISSSAHVIESFQNYTTQLCAAQCLNNSRCIFSESSGTAPTQLCRLFGPAAYSDTRTSINVTGNAFYTKSRFIDCFVTDLHSVDRVLVDARHITGGVTSGTQLKLAADETLEFAVYPSSSTGVVARSTTSLPRGSWHRVTATHDGRVSLIYVDGVLQMAARADSASSSKASAVPVLPFAITDPDEAAVLDDNAYPRIFIGAEGTAGGAVMGGSPFIGYIADVMVSAGVHGPGPAEVDLAPPPGLAAQESWEYHALSVSLNSSQKLSKVQWTLLREQTATQGHIWITKLGLRRVEDGIDLLGQGGESLPFSHASSNLATSVSRPSLEVRPLHDDATFAAMHARVGGGASMVPASSATGGSAYVNMTGSHAGAYAEWAVHVTRAGTFAIRLTYARDVGQSSTPTMSLSVNGSVISDAISCPPTPAADGSAVATTSATETVLAEGRSVVRIAVSAASSGGPRLRGVAIQRTTQEVLQGHVVPGTVARAYVSGRWSARSSCPPRYSPVGLQRLRLLGSPAGLIQDYDCDQDGCRVRCDDPIGCEVVAQCMRGVHSVPGSATYSQGWQHVATASNGGLKGGTTPVWTSGYVKVDDSTADGDTTLDLGVAGFNALFNSSASRIIRRTCSACAATHQEIYYRRFATTDWDAWTNMVDQWMSTNNDMSNGDFALYSTYEDALARRNAWTYCNYNDAIAEASRVGFPRDCGPSGAVGSIWNAYSRAAGNGQLGITFDIDVSPQGELGATQLATLRGAERIAFAWSNTNRPHSDTADEALVAQTGIEAWFKSSSIAGASVWTSSVSSPSLGTFANVNVASGSVSVVQETGGSSSTVIKSWQGSNTTVLTFANGSLTLATAHTVCSLTRYTSTDASKQGPILRANDTTFVYGHYDGLVGVAKAGAWITSSNASTVESTTHSTTDWLVMCSTNGAPRVMSNGNGASNGVTGSAPSDAAALTVNSGTAFTTCQTLANATAASCSTNSATGVNIAACEAITGVALDTSTACDAVATGCNYTAAVPANTTCTDPVETSDFAVAEVIVWNRALTTNEMQDASRYLLALSGGSIRTDVSIDEYDFIAEVDPAGLADSSRDDSTAGTCSGPNYHPVAVRCLKGDCNLPGQMYLGTHNAGTCQGLAYGLVAPSGAENCDDTSGYSNAIYLRRAFSTALTDGLCMGAHTRAFTAVGPAYLKVNDLGAAGGRIRDLVCDPTDGCRVQCAAPSSSSCVVAARCVRVGGSALRPIARDGITYSLDPAPDLRPHLDSTSSLLLNGEVAGNAGGRLAHSVPQFAAWGPAGDGTARNASVTFDFGRTLWVEQVVVHLSPSPASKPFARMASANRFDVTVDTEHEELTGAYVAGNNQASWSTTAPAAFGPELKVETWDVQSTYYTTTYSNVTVTSTTCASNSTNSSNASNASNCSSANATNTVSSTSSNVVAEWVDVSGKLNAYGDTRSIAIDVQRSTSRVKISLLALSIHEAMYLSEVEFFKSAGTWTKLLADATYTSTVPFNGAPLAAGTFCKLRFVFKRSTTCPLCSSAGYRNGTYPLELVMNSTYVLQQPDSSTSLPDQCLHPLRHSSVVCHKRVTLTKQDTLTLTWYALSRALGTPSLGSASFTVDLYGYHDAACASNRHVDVSVVSVGSSDPSGVVSANVGPGLTRETSVQVNGVEHSPDAVGFNVISFQATDGEAASSAHYLTPAISDSMVGMGALVMLSGPTLLSETNTTSNPSGSRSTLEGCRDACLALTDSCNAAVFLSIVIPLVGNITVCKHYDSYASTTDVLPSTASLGLAVGSLTAAMYRRELGVPTKTSATMLSDIAALPSGRLVAVVAKGTACANADANVHTALGLVGASATCGGQGGSLATLGRAGGGLWGQPGWASSRQGHAGDGGSRVDRVVPLEPNRRLGQQSLVMDGVDDCLFVPTHELSVPVRAVSAWVRIDSSGTPGRSEMLVDVEGMSNAEIGSTAAGVGSAWSSVYAGAVSLVPFAGTAGWLALPKAQWFHLYAELSADAPAASNVTMFCPPANLTNGSALAGGVKDIRIWSRSLTAAEIAFLATSSHRGVDLHGLAAHLPVDDGSGSTLADPMVGSGVVAKAYAFGQEVGSSSGGNWTNDAPSVPDAVDTWADAPPVLSAYFDVAAKSGGGLTGVFADSEGSSSSTSTEPFTPVAAAARLIAGGGGGGGIRLEGASSSVVQPTGGGGGGAAGESAVGCTGGSGAGGTGAAGGAAGGSTSSGACTGLGDCSGSSGSSLLGGDGGYLGAGGGAGYFGGGGGGGDCTISDAAVVSGGGAGGGGSSFLHSTLVANGSLVDAANVLGTNSLGARGPGRIEIVALQPADMHAPSRLIDGAHSAFVGGSIVSPNMWLTASGVAIAEQFVAFDLGYAYRIDQVDVRNLQSCASSIASLRNSSVRSVTLQREVNTNVTSLAAANWTNVVTLTGPLDETSFSVSDFGLLASRFWRLNVLDNYGGNETGFCGISFKERQLEPEMAIDARSSIACEDLAWSSGSASAYVCSQSTHLCVNSTDGACIAPANCSGLRTYEAAQTMCTRKGARLCTLAEAAVAGASSTCAYSNASSTAHVACCADYGIHRAGATRIRTPNTLWLSEPEQNVTEQYITFNLTRPFSPRRIDIENAASCAAGQAGASLRDIVVQQSENIAGPWADVSSHTDLNQTRFELSLPDTGVETTYWRIRVARNYGGNSTGFCYAAFYYTSVPAITPPSASAVQGVSAANSTASPYVSSVYLTQVPRVVGSNQATLTATSEAATYRIIASGSRCGGLVETRAGLTLTECASICMAQGGCRGGFTYDSSCIPFNTCNATSGDSSGTWVYAVPKYAAVNESTLYDPAASSGNASNASSSNATAVLKSESSHLQFCAATGRWYAFVNTNRSGTGSTWAEASAAAESVGASLASISSQAEQECVASLTTTMAWIGGVKTEPNSTASTGTVSRGAYRWSDGTSGWAFDNFGNGRVVPDSTAVAVAINVGSDQTLPGIDEAVDSGLQGGWGDVEATQSLGGYIAEFVRLAPPSYTVLGGGRALDSLQLWLPFNNESNVMHAAQPTLWDASGRQNVIAVTGLAGQGALGLQVSDTVSFTLHDQDSYCDDTLSAQKQSWASYVTLAECARACASLPWCQFMSLSAASGCRAHSSCDRVVRGQAGWAVREKVDSLIFPRDRVAVPGTGAYALRFDNSNGTVVDPAVNESSSGALGEYVEVSHSGLRLRLEGAGTAMVWFKLSSNTSHLAGRGGCECAPLLSDAQRGALEGRDRPSLQLAVGADGRPRCIFGEDRTTTPEVIGRSTVYAGAWHHLACAFDGAEARLYLDGALDAWSSAPASPGPVPSTPGRHLYIGAEIGSAMRLHGAVGDVRLYRAALTAHDIADVISAYGDASTGTVDPSVATGSGARYATSFDDAGSSLGWGGRQCLAQLRWQGSSCVDVNASVMYTVSVGIERSAHGCAAAAAKEGNCGSSSFQWASSTRTCRCTRPGTLCERRCVPVVSGMDASTAVSGANVTHLFEAPASCATLTAETDADWSLVYSKAAYAVTYDAGAEGFNGLFQRSPWQIIRRTCTTCLSDYQDIYYRRYTKRSTFRPFSDLLVRWTSEHHTAHTDYDIFSSLADAMAGTNPWTACTYDVDGEGFPGDCGPSGLNAQAGTNDQWNGPGQTGIASFEYHVYTGGARVANGTFEEEGINGTTAADGTASAVLQPTGNATTSGKLSAQANRTGVLGLRFVRPADGSNQVVEGPSAIPSLAGGHTYTLSFWARCTSLPLSECALSATLIGVAVYEQQDMVNPTWYVTPEATSTNGQAAWSKFSVQFTPAATHAAATGLRFTLLGGNSSGANATLDLDDVDVKSALGCRVRRVVAGARCYSSATGADNSDGDGDVVRTLSSIYASSLDCAVAARTSALCGDQFQFNHLTGSCQCVRQGFRCSSRCAKVEVDGQSLDSAVYAAGCPRLVNLAAHPSASASLVGQASIGCGVAHAAIDGVHGRSERAAFYGHAQCARASATSTATAALQVILAAPSLVNSIFVTTPEEANQYTTSEGLAELGSGTTPVGGESPTLVNNGVVVTVDGTACPLLGGSGGGSGAGAGGATLEGGIARAGPFVCPSGTFGQNVSVTATAANATIAVSEVEVWGRSEAVASTEAASVACGP
eukprot:g59.t1